MAFTIVRNDIVRMRVDAIVNSTNEALQPGGLGVDAGIHLAAGPRLAAALAEIGSCPVGSAVLTEAFDIPGCRYIIHAVGPAYRDGRHGEEELLRGCYRSILSLAREKGCRSLAIPSISAGASGFPKEAAYRIATGCIRDFLFSLPEDEDMMIYLVLFDQRTVDFSSRIDGEPDLLIEPAYPAAKKARLGAVSAPLADRRRRNAAPVYAAAAAEHESCAPEEDYSEQDLSFAEMCEWWCRRKGLSKKAFYIDSNINKAMFWNMKHHPDQTPRKTNVLACAVGLRLDYAQTQDLLMRAGLTLSRFYALDRAVEVFIRRGNADIFEINEALFEQDLPLLGAY